MGRWERTRPLLRLGLNLSCFADCDAELSVRPPRLCGQRPADRGAGREPGVLPQPVDSPPHGEPRRRPLPHSLGAAAHRRPLSQAIENFAVTVKTTAQMLQRFGTDLAETELPNDIQSTKDLLVTHTDKHSSLKVSGPLGGGSPGADISRFPVSGVRVRIGHLPDVTPLGGSQRSDQLDPVIS